MSLQIFTTDKRDKETGYKLVLVGEDGEFYSTFTGQKYNKNWLPKVEMSLVEVPYWKNLTRNKFFFNENMVGRTFVFKYLKDAEWLYRHIGNYYHYDFEKKEYFTELVVMGVKRRFKLAVVEATVYSVFRALFGVDKGFVGRRIVINEEVCW